LLLISFLLLHDDNIGTKDKNNTKIRIKLILFITFPLLKFNKTNKLNIEAKTKAFFYGIIPNKRKKKIEQLNIINSKINQMEREYNLKITNLIESYGYNVFLPQRDGFLAPELEGLTEEEKIIKIFNKDKEEVLKADIVFVILDGRVPDEGACIELGIAYSNNKRCYGLKSDARSVELDMDLNPMIIGCLDKLFYNLNDKELMEDLKNYLETNQL
jgi:nucleoside 2-deoxyribosyltransferase